MDGCPLRPGRCAHRSVSICALFSAQAEIIVQFRVWNIGLGMAGTEPVSIKRLEKLARLIHEVEPELWSEHLAFVRAAGVEIGHLAAPPRNHSSVEGAAENLRKAAHMIGMQPAMENIATLLQPPCSTL